jgi:hypothetical protein
VVLGYWLVIDFEASRRRFINLVVSKRLGMPSRCINAAGMDHLVVVEVLDTIERTPGYRH